MAFEPLLRHQFRATQSARGEIFAVISHDAKKRVIGFENCTFGLPDEDADDIGVYQAPDFGFASCEIAIQVGSLNRNPRQMGDLFYGPLIARARAPRLAIIHGEGANHLAY